MLKQLLTSKKAIATIVAVVVWTAGRFGLDLDTADLIPIVGALVAYVLGQGLADVGKSAAQLKDGTR